MKTWRSWWSRRTTSLRPYPKRSTRPGLSHMRDTMPRMTDPQQVPQSQQQQPDIPYVMTYPAQDSSLVQPTLGRIVMGVFLGNLMTGLVGLLVWLIIFAAS